MSLYYFPELDEIYECKKQVGNVIYVKFYDGTIAAGVYIGEL